MVKQTQNIMGFNINIEGNSSDNTIIESKEMLDLINKMRLSMKAHPGYQTGENQEFVDYVEMAEDLLERAGKYSRVCLFNGSAHKVDGLQARMNRSEKPNS